MRSDHFSLMMALLIGLFAGCSNSAPTNLAESGADKKSPAEERAAELFAQYQRLSAYDKHGAKGNELINEIDFLMGHISLESRRKMEECIEAHKKALSDRVRIDRPYVQEYDPETGIELLPPPREKK